MKDINFFLPYIEKRKVKFDNRFFLAILFFMCSMVILTYTLINEFKIKKLSEQVVELESFAENPRTLKKVEQIRVEEEYLERFKLEVESVRALKESIAEKDKIDSNYLNTIIQKRPVDIFLTSLDISPEDVSISGISNNRLSIAEFAKGLKSIEDIGDIFVSNISKEELDYKFILESNYIEEEVEEDGTLEEEEDQEIEEEDEE